MKNNNLFSLSDLGYVHRVIVGCNNPEIMVDEEKTQRQILEVNRCLSEYPKGKIIGIEKNFFILNIGEHQTVVQYLVYHIGFNRKPDWIK